MGKNLEELKAIARRIRYDIIKMTYHAGSGHPGGSLSMAEGLTALYFDKLNHNPKNPWMDGRDRVILSKGHAAPLLYATLAEAGYFERKELWTLRKLGSRLQGHPGFDQGLPGIEISTGSLGQGLSIANGVAISAKHVKKEDYRVYCVLGDGEIQEGQVWEAAMTSSHYSLDNLCAVVDNNNLQIDGCVPDVMCIEPIDKKFEAFGFHVIKIDGHCIESFQKAYDEAASIEGKPTVIIADTVKGQGISFMEDEAGWHGKAPNKEQAEKAITELGFDKNLLEELEEN
ncbi:MAG: transketolase [Candidatus Zixiibacteriota bacterium]